MDEKGNVIPNAIVEIHHSPFCQIPFDAHSKTNEHGICHIYVPENEHDSENLEGVWKGKLNHV